MDTACCLVPSGGYCHGINESVRYLSRYMPQDTIGHCNSTTHASAAFEQDGMNPSRIKISPLTDFPSSGIFARPGNGLSSRIVYSFSGASPCGRTDKAWPSFNWNTNTTARER